MRTAIRPTVLAIALACSLFAAPALAQRARVFVASYGNDGNPCTFLSPCRTFQQAVNVVLPAGEVTVLDSAGYGPVSIHQAVTITSPEGVEGGIVQDGSGNAITIQAGPTDPIVLRGLTLNGFDLGSNGVLFQSGGSLTVTNCVIQNFTFAFPNFASGNGILFQPTTGTVDFVISNTMLLNNTNSGINYSPPGGSPSANGLIDHVTVAGNGNGNSLGAGISIGGSGAISLSINDLSASGNYYGIAANGSANVFLGRSVITGNNVAGILNNTMSNTFYTYGNNQFDPATSNTALNTSLPLH